MKLACISLAMVFANASHSRACRKTKDASAVTDRTGHSSRLNEVLDGFPGRRECTGSERGVLPDLPCRDPLMEDGKVACREDH